MFACIGLGTDFTFKVKKIDDNKLVWVENRFLFCMSPSPCPCAPCCGFGPLAQAPKWVRDPADSSKFNGSGESICAGGCCQMMMHNKGDVFVWNSEKDGSSMEKAMEFYAGYSPAYPPCLQGSFVAKGVFVDKKGGAPTTDEMQR